MEEPLYHFDRVVRAREELMEDFDGPLDLILLLLSKNKIEIQDIRIASILEQYMAYLEHMKQMDMEIASDFIAMASHLMLIKTKMLLSAADRQEALTEMELLIQSLEERQRKEAFQQIKAAVEFLSSRNEIGINLFSKEPEPIRKDHTYRYEHPTSDLCRAMALIAERSERALPPPISNFTGIVGKEPYPVTQKAAEILRKLLLYGLSGFQRLFRNNRSKSEIVATFLAVLELCKLRSVEVVEEIDGSPAVRFLQMPEEDVSEGDLVNGAK